MESGRRDGRRAVIFCRLLRHLRRRASRPYASGRYHAQLLLGHSWSRAFCIGIELERVVFIGLLRKDRFAPGSSGSSKRPSSADLSESGSVKRELESSSLSPPPAPGGTPLPRPAPRPAPPLDEDERARTEAAQERQDKELQELLAQQRAALRMRSSPRRHSPRRQTQLWTDAMTAATARSVSLDSVHVFTSSASCSTAQNKRDLKPCINRSCGGGVWRSRVNAVAFKVSSRSTAAASLFRHRPGLADTFGRRQRSRSTRRSVHRHRALAHSSLCAVAEAARRSAARHVSADCARDDG